MQTFKSIASVEALRHSPLQSTLKNLVAMVIEDQPDYRPEDDGYLEALEKALTWELPEETPANVVNDQARLMAGVTPEESWETAPG